MNPDQVAEAVPVEALSAWIAANVSSASGPVGVSHLSGGSSNLTVNVSATCASTPSTAWSSTTAVSTGSR